VICKAGDPEVNAVIKALNARLRAHCTEAHVAYLDLNAVLAPKDELRRELSTDGTHLKPEAYPLWAKLVAAKLQELGF